MDWSPSVHTFRYVHCVHTLTFEQVHSSMPLYSTNWHGSLILILQVHLVMGIDAACSDDFMVNGKQVISLLPSVCLGAVEAFLRSLRELPFLKPFCVFSLSSSSKS